MSAPDRKCSLVLRPSAMIAANRTVFGLVAGIGRDVAADTPPIVVGRVVVHEAILDVGRRAVHAVGRFDAYPTANLDAHIGAGNVIEPHTVQAAYLHVLDRLGLDGKIGCLRPSYRNESRCRAEEKTFHHLHLEPPKKFSLRGFRVRPVRQHPLELPLAPRWPEKPFAPLWCNLQPGQRNRWDAPLRRVVTLAEGPL